jgi:hypothetical protein
MNTPQIWHGGHRQAARNLTIVVIVTALAGTAAAIAASGGSPTNAAADGVKSAKPGPTRTDGPPLPANAPVVTQMRARLADLVARGAIDQAEADTVLQRVIAGSIAPAALIRAGQVSADHMAVINDALHAVKPLNTAATDKVKHDKLAADGRKAGD